MDYQNFDVEEFALDPSFQQWVLYPAQESELFWASWLLQYPEKKPVVEQARAIILSLDFEDDLTVDEIEEEWDKLYSKIAYTSFSNLEYAAGAGAKPAWWQSYRNIAAVFIGLLLFSGIYLAVSFSNKAENISYATSYGQTKKVALPDGSIVTLNANSKITFPAKWEEDDAREVWLDGEAFFSVTHTKNHQRFIVHTDEQSSIEVLGTKFNVYDRRKKVRVVLEAGKVQVTAKEQSQRMLMAPGELVEWSRGDSKLRKRKVNPYLYSSWKEHELLFEKASLAEVARVLEDIYGVVVDFKEPSLRKLRFTGSLSTNNLDDFLVSLSKSFKINVQHEGNQIILDKTKNKFL